MNTVLSLDHVSVALGGRPVLRDVDLAVAQSEVVALVGANGSGKSTIVRTAVGLVAPREGTVSLFGVPVHELRAWGRVGYVPQRVAAATGIPATVREVVATGRLSHRRPLLPPSARDREAVRQALDAVGLAERAQHQVGTLSGGQQQRVLVARALASQPDLMFLDEPNAGVDAESQQRIADTLAERAASGVTLVLVLHELGPFEPLIDRAVVVREGHVAYDGPPEAAFAEAMGASHHHPEHGRYEPGRVHHPLDGGH